MDDHIDELLGACLAVVEGRLPAEQLPELGGDDVAAIVDRVHVYMAEFESARAAHAAEHELTIACQPGCDYCCANLIIVYRPEAIGVAAWLNEPAHGEARAHFEQSYPRWRTEVGEDADRLKKLHESGDIAAAEALYAKVQSRHVPCAFVAAGRCVIHPVRPNVCRNAHALDSSEGCRPDSDQGPRAIAFPPLDSFVAKASAVFRVLHQRDRGAEAPSTLCDSVKFLLEDASPAEPG